VVNKSTPIFCCPKCGSESTVSYGKCYLCIDCGKYTAKVQKKDDPDWQQWNKGLTKETDERVRIAGERALLSKKKNPDFIKTVISNLPDPKITISIDEMKELYQSMSQREIAERLCVSQGAVSMFMKRHNITARSTGEAGAKHGDISRRKSIKKYQSH